MQHQILQTCAPQNEGVKRRLQIPIYFRKRDIPKARLFFQKKTDNLMTSPTNLLNIYALNI